MSTSKLPLVVDIDDTFLRTDILFELFWAAMAQHPFQVLGLCARHFGSPAVLKSKLAELTDLDVGLLPVNPDVANLIDEAKQDGRDVIFASASDKTLVDALAAHHEIEGDHLGSDGQTNLKGSAKAQALVDRYGEGGFAYAGDAAADLAIWEKSGEAILVNAPSGIAGKLARTDTKVTDISAPRSLTPLIKEMRPHQWVKNVLLFLPIIAAHRTDLLGYMTVFMGVLAYCAAASSIYIVNDLLDLEADRQHPTKRFRPLASGALKIRTGMTASVLLGLTALGIGAFLGPLFFGVVVVYIITSLMYSLKLKRLAWIDILVLSGLYTLRVIAGAAAASVVASGWLIAFIFPAFVALGCTKRLTELALVKHEGKVPGRGYVAQDRQGLLNLATAGLIGAMAVLVIYTFGPAAQALYDDMWMMRLAIITVGYWLSRMVLLGWQGQQDYDPIVFAMRDSTGILVIIMTLAILFYAAGIL